MNEIQKENNQRLDILHRKHYKWLLGSAYRISKQLDTSKELISELYLYLASNPNPNLWYDTEDGEKSFNLIYCRSFISSRFINKVKRDNKTLEFVYVKDIEDEEYNEEFDKSLEETHNFVLQELNKLSQTKHWAGAKLAHLYFFSDFTLDGLAKEIGISKSTCFLQIKKIKGILKENVDTPFTTNKD
jgi:hypothetical protein